MRPVFWVFFVFWFGVFATIALIIVINYRGFGRSNPELKQERMRAMNMTKAAREWYMDGRRSGLGVVLWAAFLANLCGAALSRHAAIVHWMHEAWNTFLVTFDF